MQRTKIKVGQEYAVSNYRDWHQYGVKFAQVLDTDRWEIVSKWDEKRRAEDPETVVLLDNNGQPASDFIEVPRHIRRDSGRRYRSSANLVLIRYVHTLDGGEREYGEPALLETRNLVAERADAEQRIASYQAQRDEEHRKANEERDQRIAKRADFNARCEALGVGSVGQPFGGDRWALDEATLETLIALAEKGQRYAGEEALMENDDFGL